MDVSSLPPPVWGLIIAHLHQVNDRPAFLSTCRAFNDLKNYFDQSVNDNASLKHAIRNDLYQHVEWLFEWRGTQSQRLNFFTPAIIYALVTEAIIHHAKLTFNFFFDHNLLISTDSIRNEELLNEAVIRDNYYAVEKILHCPGLCLEKHNKAFYLACSCGSLESLKKIIKNGNYDATDILDKNLIGATMREHLSIVKMLLTQAGITQLGIQTGLRYAFARKNKEIAKLYLNDGRADPTVEENRLAVESFADPNMLKLLIDDKRADLSAQNNTAVVSSAFANMWKSVEVLLSDPRVDPSAEGNIVLMQASAKGKTKIVQTLLRNYPSVDPSAVNNRALLNAVQYGHIKIVKMFLEDPRIRPFTCEEYNILMSAAGSGNVAILQLLLDHLDSDHKDPENLLLLWIAANGTGEQIKTVLLCDKMHLTDKEISEALIEATEWNNQSTFDLITQDFRVHLGVNESQSFINACKNDNMDMAIQLLRSREIDAAAQENKAIKVACANDHIGIIELLLSLPSVDPGANHQTALFKTIKHGRIEAMKILLRHPLVNSNDLHFKRRIIDRHYDQTHIFHQMEEICNANKNKRKRNED